MLSGRVDADGGAGTATVDRAEDNHLVPPGSLRDLALQHGLQQAAVRPPLRSYAAELWKRRYFISGFATARNIAMYTEARLGQLWQVLTPLLNAGVYYLIFGLLLGTNRGVPDYVSFLVTGVFVFNFTQRAFITSSQVIRDTLPLIRALYFPRACLPLGYVLIELQQLVAVLRRAVHHRRDRRRAAHPVLAVHHPGADPAEHLQRGLRAHPGPLGGQHRRRQPAAAVHRADLDVHLGRAVQPADADPDPARQAARPPDARLSAADQPGRGVHHAGQVGAAGGVPGRAARRPAVQLRQVPAVPDVPRQHQVPRATAPTAIRTRCPASPACGYGAPAGPW